MSKPLRFFILLDLAILLLGLFALFSSTCPRCVLALPFPQHLMPGARVPIDTRWIRYEYEYMAYGTYYTGEWANWRVYAGASSNVISYAGFICKTKDCGLYLGDVIALYGVYTEMHHAYTVCIYEWPGIWLTARSDVRKGRFGCRDMRKPVRSMSFR